MSSTAFSPSASAPTLRPYQAEAVEAIAAGLRTGGVGQLHAACGSGKSLMIQKAAEEVVPDGATVALLTPSLALVAQTVASWRRFAGRPLSRVLAVCSDDTVTDAAARLKEIDAETTTDARTIRAWLDVPAPGLRLIVGTYRSAARLAEAVRDTGKELDFLGLDEAHHLTGRAEVEIRRVVDRQWLPARRRLYATATPRVDIRALDNRASGSEYRSMDDGNYGPVLYSYPFVRAIADGYLEDYRLAVIGVPDSQARQMLADDSTEYVEGIGAPSLQTIVAQVALARAHEQFGVRRAISFHARVEDAAEFSRTLPATLRRIPQVSRYADALYSRHVHGKMDQRTREAVLDGLREPPQGGWAVASNARCLGEGIDVPAVDGVLFAHPKSSAVDIVQAVGRALRRHPDTPGPSTIIVPIVVPDAGGEIADLESGDYATLWRVVRALRAHDEPLGAALDQTRLKDSVSNPSLPDKLTVVMPQGTSAQILSQLSLLLVRQTTSPWWEGYGEAVRFHGDNGDLRVPTDHVTTSGHHLFAWLEDARKHRRRGWLPPDRIAALDKLGMVWEPHKDAWEKNLQALRDYQAEYGDLLIRQDYVIADGNALGKWVNLVRARHAEGRLSQHRVEALNAMGFAWYGDRRKGLALAAARAFHTQHADLDVPADYRADDGYDLNAGLTYIRKRRRDGLLDQETVEAFDALGMVWDSLKTVRSAATWKEFGTVCRQLRAAGADLMKFPRDYTLPDGYPLGARITYYRALLNRGELLPHQRAELDSLGLGEDKGEAKWRETYARLRAFHARESHLRVPDGHFEGGRRLDAALANLRKRYKEGTLNAQRVRQMEELGIDWDPMQAAWTAFLQACRAYRQTHGALPRTLPKPWTTPDGYPLAQRLDYYRNRAREGKLPPTPWPNCWSWASSSHAPAASPLRHDTRPGPRSPGRSPRRRTIDRASQRPLIRWAERSPLKVDAAGFAGACLPIPRPDGQQAVRPFTAAD
jgi:superfamily II DNA or RNA helicase